EEEEQQEGELLLRSRSSSSAGAPGCSNGRARSRSSTPLLPPGSPSPQRAVLRGPAVLSVGAQMVRRACALASVDASKGARGEPGWRDPQCRLVLREGPAAEEAEPDSAAAEDDGRVPKSDAELCPRRWQERGRQRCGPRPWLPLWPERGPEQQPEPEPPRGRGRGGLRLEGKERARRGGGRVRARERSRSEGEERTSRARSALGARAALPAAAGRTSRSTRARRWRRRRRRAPGAARASPCPRRRSGRPRGPAAASAPGETRHDAASRPAWSRGAPPFSADR
ncbi:unnamed protein product, partial [Prorocentrum cordatum]